MCHYVSAEWILGREAGAVPEDLGISTEGGLLTPLALGR
jgi:hypothetical protein